MPGADGIAGVNMPGRVKISVEEAFAQRGWLSRQTPAFRSEVLAAARTQRFARDAPIYHIGDEPGGIYGVLSGSVGVYVATARHMPMLSHVLRRGEWFGEGPVLTGRRRSLAFTAIEPTTLLQVPLAALRALTAPDAQRRLGEMAEMGADTAVNGVCDLLIGAAERRIAAVLLRVTGFGEMAPENPEGFLLTQGRLGEMANVSRHHVNRTIGQFADWGWVSKRYNRLLILNAEALGRFAYSQD